MNFTATLLKARFKDRKAALLLILLATLATSAMLTAVGGMFHLSGARSRQTVQSVIGPIDRVIISGTTGDWEASKTRYGSISPPAPLSREIINLSENHQAIRRSDQLTYARVELLDPQQKFSGSMYNPGYTRPTPIYCVKNDQMPPPHLVPGLTKAVWEKCLRSNLIILPEIKDYFHDGGDIRYKTGADLLVSAEKASHRVTVGFTYPTKGYLQNFGGIFVSEQMFKQLTGSIPRTNRIYVELKDKSKHTAQKFDTGYNKAAAAATMPSALLTQEDYIEHRTMGGGFGILPFSGTVLTTIGAFFIIIFAVGIGNKSQITESLGLRALGIPKGRVTTVILLETLIPALTGCLLGLIVARLLFQFGIQDGRGGMSFNEAENLGTGIYNTAVLTMAPAALLITLISSLSAVLPVAATIYRRHPLETSSDQSLNSTTPQKLTIPLIVSAVVLISVNPLIAAGKVVPDQVRWFGVPLTYLCVLTGLLILINPLVRFWQKLLIVPMAAFCRLNSQLTKNILAVHRSKIAVGTASIVIGLGLFIATYIWGSSMKTPFLMTEKTPDISTVTFPDGLSDKAVTALSKAPFLKKFLPIHIQHPTISDHQVKKIKLVYGDWRDLILIGAKDIKQLFGSSGGIIQGTLIKGDPSTCFQQVNNGEGVIITAELYRTNSNLYQIGNNLEIQKLNDNSVHPRKIVGVIEMPGWHMFTKSTRMRRGLGRLSGLVFGAESMVKQLYPNSKARCFWMNVDKSKLPAMDEPSSKHQRQRTPKSKNSHRKKSPSDSVNAVEQLFEKAIDKNSGAYLRVVDTAEMNKLVQARCSRVIDMAARLPYYALLLSAIAIAATAAASIRIRAREIGILRAVGASKHQLFRLLWIESMIIIAAAIVLGVLFGLIVSWSGIVVSAESWGVSAPYLIPWGIIAKGSLISAGAGLLGITLPVWLALKKDTLSLLKEQKEQ